MAGDAKKLQPIIVKRVKKSGHAAHGGAWKIAYADFVTAMMAFFLLMWLLGSTAKGDLQGIAAHFTMPLKVALMGGDGAGNSTSVISGGGKDLTMASGQKNRSESEARPNQRKMTAEEMKAEIAKQDSARIANLQQKIKELIAQNPKLAEFGSQIKLEITPDGLQIQIVDDQNRPMFDSGSQLVKPYMRDILREIGSALNGVDNRISLSGHTDATPYGNGDRGYSNWELSADRANASRRELVAAGMPDDKLARIVGQSSSSLMDPQNPTSPTNRRITILVLTREAESRLMGKPEPVLPGVSLAEPAAPAAESAPGAPAANSGGQTR
jgi:chemotaxis protein MotB